MNLDLAFEASLPQLALTSDRLEDTLQRQGVHAERVGRVRLIVEELACNAIGHGARAGERALLRLRVRLDAARLELEFRDDGGAFDPREAPRPALEAALEARPVGGLGLFLVQQLADHIAYRRDGAYNIVSITLLRPYSPAESTP